MTMQQHDETDGDRDRDREGQRLAAARDYTRRGWRGTPLMPGGKAATPAGRALVGRGGGGGRRLGEAARRMRGERVGWAGEGGAGGGAGPGLEGAVAWVAGCGRVARLWPGGGARDEAALALAGLLLRGGLAAEE